jgi:hypothetical protein
MPNNCSEPWSVRASFVMRMLCPSVYHWMAPVMTVAIPRVAMKGFTPTRATRKPLTAPTAVPMATPTSTATASGSSKRVSAAAVAIADSSMFRPTEKSNWPAINGMIAARARMARTDSFPAMFRKLFGVQNTSPDSGDRLKTAITTRNSASSP